MAKNKKQKYYAIKEGKGVKDKIVLTWTECEKLVKGYPSVYKSFSTNEEALSYLSSVNVDKVKQQTKIGMEHTRKIKSTTRPLNLRLDKCLIDRFEDKCMEIGLSKEVVIKGMIEEWLD